MLKFWLTLILGTIMISSGLTYLKLHRGAQTISYPPPAPKQEVALVEFQSIPENKTKMEVSANVVTFKVPESFVDEENTMTFLIKNNGKADLEMSLLSKSCNCSEIYFDDQRVSLTDHMRKVAPGKTATIKLNYRPKSEQLKDSGTSRIRATFTHNDERFSDNLHFEVVTTVKDRK
ncbi:MAG TPA: DUF1573 domain-containing protein [Gemmatales bacterium]|nr:DUF1573 domain-containing protein [Gemmatales bacterium]HMP16273.1 DUF1573 domain-containing protein [Gemmatales bacterium]